MLKAAFKSLLDRKLRLLLSTSAIVLGVGFVVGSLVFTDMLSSGFTKIFERATGDVVVRDVNGVDEFGSPTTKTVPASLVDELAAIPGAARADGNVSAAGVFVIGADGKQVGGLGAPGLAFNWSDAPGQSGEPVATLVDGRAPEKTGEVVIDSRTAEKAGYVVGDDIKLVTNGSTDQVAEKLVGIIEFADGGTLAGASLTVFDTKTAQDLFLDGRDEFTDIWVTAEDGVSQDELRDAAAAVLPAHTVALTGEKVAKDSADVIGEALGFLRTFLLVFAGISLFVGAFLIVNTFAILVAQRSRELALFRALGASSRQVFSSVILEAFVVGVLGSTIGLGFGLVLAKLLQAMFAAFGLDLAGQALVVTPMTVLAAYGIGIVVTVLAAAIPAWRARRVPPIQALSDVVAMPEGSLGRRLIGGLAMAALGVVGMTVGLLTDIPRSGWVTVAGAVAVLLGTSLASPAFGRPLLTASRAVFRRVFGAVGSLAGENARRNPRRTAATASALMIGLSLACAVAILGASGKESAAVAIDKSFSGDYVVGNNSGQTFSPDVARKMSQVDGVTQVVRQRYGVGLLNGERQFLGAIDPAGFGSVVKVDTYEGDIGDFKDGTLVVDRTWAEGKSLHPGSEVTIALPSGKETFTVAAVVEPDPLLFLPAMTIDDLAAAGFPKQDAMLLIAADGDRLQALQDVVKDNPLVIVNDQAGLIKQQNDQANQGLLMIYGLLALALIIAVLGIVNTLALSVIERTREIGLLRAVGMTRRQLRRMVSLESVAIAVLGSLMGLGLGIFFGLAVWKAFENDGLNELSIPYGQLGIFVVAAVFVGVLAAVFPARRAAKLDVLKAIATE
ncbi:MAG: FtsX-like permease family protein [Nocardioidaceae bacterium]